MAVAPARRDVLAAPGVGIGWRPELAADLLTHPDAVALVEVTAEGCTTAASLREVQAVAEAWPVVVHGVKASLGSAEGLDRDRVRKLGQVARAVGAPCISEHVAFVRAGGVEIGHLTGLPFTREAIRVVARNVAEARRLLPDVPLLLENVARSFRWPDDAMDEGDFHAEIAAATGCDLLLDVGNLHANALNAGRDPFELLARYPLDRVAMLHVAGGLLEDGFYFDTHAHAVPGAVIELAARALSLAGDVPVVLERDAAFPAFAELGAEVARLAGLPRPAVRARSAGSATAAHGTGGAAHRPPAATRDVPDAADALRDAQAAIARLLTAPAVPADREMARAREILRRKRVDDALPLLPTLAAMGEPAFALAARCLEAAARPASMVAVADALRVARAAEEDPALARAARGDAALLRARFVVEGDGVRPRAAPFVERVRGVAGGTRWIVKGPGKDATVRVIQGRAGT